MGNNPGSLKPRQRLANEMAGAAKTFEQSILSKSRSRLQTAENDILFEFSRDLFFECVHCAVK